MFQVSFLIMSSISRLPDSATRFIGANVVVVTPDSVVKELLENAIDAKATSVEILVSSDTISKVEVRDDGVGIHPDDYDALGRRGHTSKLRNYEELASVVGKTLGFRGEALASVNSMAEVTITTKTSTEPVAAALQLVPIEGGVLTQKTTSAPVGTTITLTKLFGRQPVREQMAAKEAKKTLDKIQELLRSYAMARPQLKLLYKVLQPAAKIWSYSPKRNATAAEAALQLFGTELTTNCFLKTVQIGNSVTESRALAQRHPGYAAHGFRLEAFIVNPDADLQKLVKRHYFSVDGRPINAGRGVAKRLLSIYLDYLKRSTLTKDIYDCFIRLDIQCPPGSYDANIEPSKDNVLFLEEQTIPNTFKHLCDEVYKPTTRVNQSALNKVNTETSYAPSTDSLGQGQLRHGHELQVQPNIFSSTMDFAANNSGLFPEGSCFNSKPSNDEAKVIEDSGGHKGSKETPFLPCLQLEEPISGYSRAGPVFNQCKVDMSVDLSEGAKRSYQQQHQLPLEPLNSEETLMHEALSAAIHLNPWLTMKARDPSEGLLSSSDAAIKHAESRLTPEPPILRHDMAPPKDLDIPQSQQQLENARLYSHQGCLVPGGPYRSPMSSPLTSQPRGAPAVPPNQPRMVLHRRRKQLPWTPPSSVEKNRLINHPLIDSPNLQRADNFKQTRISFGATQPSRCQRGAQSDVSVARGRTQEPPNKLEIEGVHLQDMFSTAKQNLHYQLSQIENSRLTKAAKNSKHPRQFQQPSSQRPPFSVLQANTVRNTQDVQENERPIPTTLPTGDPRAYLLRRQKSMAAEEESGAKPKKSRRLKSSLMPLENIPSGLQTYSLSLALDVKTRILELVRWSGKYDDYVIYGTLVDGLDMSLSEGHEIESRIQGLLTQQKENIGGVGSSNDKVTINL
jgi:DNA mismatch repair protein MutL